MNALFLYNFSHLALDVCTLKSLMFAVISRTHVLYFYSICIVIDANYRKIIVNQMYIQYSVLCIF